jgi:hypothetical protein
MPLSRRHTESAENLLDMRIIKRIKATMIATPKKNLPGSQILDKKQVWVKLNKDTIISSKTRN